MIRIRDRLAAHAEVPAPTPVGAFVPICRIIRFLSWRYFRNLAPLDRVRAVRVRVRGQFPEPGSNACATATQWPWQDEAVTLRALPPDTNRAGSSVGLVLDPCHNFVQRNSIGTKTIGPRSAILISEGDPANDQAVVAEAEVLANEFRMRGQCRLRNRSDA